MTFLNVCEVSEWIVGEKDDFSQRTCGGMCGRTCGRACGGCGWMYGRRCGIRIEYEEAKSQDESTNDKYPARSAQDRDTVDLKHLKVSH